jgi:hypothetical protein
MLWHFKVDSSEERGGSKFEKQTVFKLVIVAVEGYLHFEDLIFV